MPRATGRLKLKPLPRRYPENCFVPKIRAMALAKAQMQLDDSLVAMQSHWFHKRGDLDVIGRLLPDMRTSRMLNTGVP